MSRVHASSILLQLVILKAIGSAFPVGGRALINPDYSFSRSMRFMKSA